MIGLTATRPKRRIGRFIRDLVMGYNHTIWRWPSKEATMSFMRTDPYVN